MTSSPHAFFLRIHNFLKYTGDTLAIFYPLKPNKYVELNIISCSYQCTNINTLNKYP